MNQCLSNSAIASIASCAARRNGNRTKQTGGPPVRSLLVLRLPREGRRHVVCRQSLPFVERNAAVVPSCQQQRVAGFAAKEPLIVSNPNDPRNRRISIVLLYNSTKDTRIIPPVGELSSPLTGDHKKNKPINPFGIPS